MAYALTLFAAHSRLLEHDADLCAADLCTNPDEDGYHRVALVLDKLAIVGGIGHDTRSWLHPTIAGRIAFLLSASRQPEAAERFQRRMAIGHRCLLFLAIALLACLALLPE